MSDDVTTGFDATAEGISHGARALLVVPGWHGQSSARDAAARQDELAGLANAIHLDVVDNRAVRVRQPRASTLFGKGQVEELAAAVKVAEAALVIVDGSLSAIQQRNLEKAFACKVIDRTALILEIFGERAATAEGRMQVELAHLDYQSGRLVRSWTHLERQRGGFGFLGGPGETQIEADRRMIRDRMARIRRQLEEVKRTRALQRSRRQRAPYPVVALVGYTNAGKSTLFNHLTQASVLAQDLLFATLDPTMRETRLPGLPKVILSDTVGFVSDLPTELIAAFRATLEEVLTADLILHVRDIAHPDSDAQADDVLAILADLGVLRPDGGDGGEPSTDIIEVWNKIDLLDEERRDQALIEAASRSDVVAISAVTGQGIDTLRDRSAARLRADAVRRTVPLDMADGRGRAWLHAHALVVDERETDGDQVVMTVDITAADWARFKSR